MRPHHSFLAPALLTAMATAAAVTSAVTPVTAAELEVVTTLPAYAAIAAAVGGDRVHVQSISRGDEDAHFVKPKPSFALMLRRADLFVTTGLDLELWVPTLLDKSGNRAIRDGQPGYVRAAEGVPLLDVPVDVDRSAGDVHIYGNPHVFTSPLNAKIVATNVAAGLERVDPAGATAYRAGLVTFQRRVDEALYGAELLELVGSDSLDRLVRDGRLLAFLRETDFQGAPLVERLGGWLGKALPFRGREIVAYHKNWVYFTDLFGLQVLDHVEPKPGIPPSARHVHHLIELIAQREVRVLLAASYFSHQQIAGIAQRTGCHAVVVDLGPSEIGPEGYFDLVDGWIDALTAAFARAEVGP